MQHFYSLFLDNVSLALAGQGTSTILHITANDYMAAKPLSRFIE